MINWQPPKIKAPPFSIFFDGVCIGIPNKSTDDEKHKPGAGHLAYELIGHRKRWGQDLGPRQLLPGGRGQSCLGGRGGRAMVAQLVVVCFCVVVTSPVESLIANRDVANLLTFVLSKQKIYISPNHPNVNSCATSAYHEDVVHALTFGWNGRFGTVLSVNKCP